MCWQEQTKSFDRREKRTLNQGIFALALCAMLLALGVSAHAQQQKKVPLLGYLSLRDQASESPRYEAIRLSLRELGYIEGQNIAIENRYGDDVRFGRKE